MAPRTYRMKRRGESAELTRQRIVEAAYALHTRHGIAATSVRDIAERADVGVGTVYHHFPTYDDVINACGAHTLHLARPPRPEVLSETDEPARRLHTLVAEVFGFYQRFPGYERIRTERDRFAQVDAFVVEDERNRASMLARALSPRKPGKRRMAMAFAVLDVCVYRALIGAGHTHRAAITDTTAMLQQWLLEPGASRAVEGGTRQP